MTDSRKSLLRSIMNMAWGSRRAEPARSFADCVRGAWAFSKRMAKACKKVMKSAKAGTHVALTNDIIRSPIRRSLTGQRNAKWRDFTAAYTTAHFGR